MENLDVTAIKVDTGIEKIPATNVPVTQMDAGDFVKSGLKVGAFAGIAYLATRAICGIADGVCNGLKAGYKAAGDAVKKVDKGGEQ